MGIPAFLFDPALHRDDPSFGCPDEADSDAGKSPSEGTENSQMAKQVRLLQSIPGIGFLSAVTLVCEIGDFSAFKRPKQLFAYFGLDPAVRQSGNFSGADLKMSKRGSPYARRCIYVLAIQSVSLRVDGTAKNPVLRSFYEEKCKASPR